MAIKSLVTHVGIDTAGKAHNCQASAKHRIEKGDVRLKVKNGRSWDHYCIACAKNIIGRDIEKLKGLETYDSSGSPEYLDARAGGDGRVIVHMRPS